MEKTAGIALLHGPHEQGKDIVFTSPGTLGETIVNAMVVKNARITGSLKGASAAREVWFQVEQALGSKYIDHSGAEQKVSKVYVVTPAEITPQSILSIQDKLVERGGQITFLGGAELVRLFRTHWPDYFADEFKFLERYCSEIRSDLQTQDELLQIARHYSSTAVTGQLPNLYIESRLHITVNECNLETFATNIKEAFSFGSIQNPLSLHALNATNSRLEYYSLLFNHLRDWGFIALSENLVDSLNAFLNELWQNGTDIHSDVTNLEAVNEMRLIAHLDELKGYFKKAANALQDAVSLIAECINFGEIALADSSFGFAYPHSKNLSRYFKAIDCIDVFRGDAPVSSRLRKTVKSRHIDPSDFNTNVGLILIVGPAGYGKTTFCRRKALKDLEAWKVDNTTFLPVHVKLASIKPSQLVSLDNLIDVGSKSALLSIEERRALLDGDQKIRIYLDGLDEVTIDEDRKTVIKQAIKAVDQHPDWQVVVTSRDYYRSLELSMIPRVQISGFDAGDLKALASIAFATSPLMAKSFLRQISDNGDLSEAAKVPLLATLLIWVFKCTGDLPAKRVELIDTFVDLLCGGWDNMKSVNRQSRFGKDAKIALLTQLACYAHEQRRTFVVVESFPSICHKAAPGIFLSGDLTQASTDCLQELLTDGLLRQDGNQLSFAHLSFQEFFAGRSLSNTPNRDAFSFAIKAYLDGDDWWRDVVVFALAQTSTPQNTVEWLETGITNEHVKNGRYAFLIGELRKVFPHIIATSLI